MLMTLSYLIYWLARVPRTIPGLREMEEFQLFHTFFKFSRSSLLTPLPQILTTWAKREERRFSESWFFHCCPCTLSAVPCSFPLGSKQGEKKHSAGDLELQALWLPACLRKKRRTKARHPTITIKLSKRQGLRGQRAGRRASFQHISSK